MNGRGSINTPYKLYMPRPQSSTRGCRYADDAADDTSSFSTLTLANNINRSGCLDSLTYVPTKGRRLTWCPNLGLQLGSYLWGWGRRSIARATLGSIIINYIN